MIRRAPSPALQGVVLVSLAVFGTACDDLPSQVNQGFYLAAAKGDEQALARLLAIDASLAVRPWKVSISRGFFDRFPLLAAAREGQAGAVRMLLDHGASVETAESPGDTPLLEAARRRHPEVVRLLLERGASFTV